MNKKKIGALLVGATLLVGAMGSFAYFTSKTSIGSAGTGGFQELEIQNGKVVITAKVTDEAKELSDWTYDVAKLSTTEDGDTEGSIKAFENKHRSPDITVESAKTANNDTTDKIPRAVIGSALPDKIQYTRPGDAIVLGKAKTGSAEANGLTITNNSNLTIRLRLKVKNSEAAEKQLEAMQAAGWKLYVNGRETSIFDKKETLNVDGEEIVLDNLKDGINLGIIGANGTIDKVDVRFELPLTTNNNYQNLHAAEKNKELGKMALNLNDLIEIQATQENNTDWEQMNPEDHVDENQPEGQ